MLAHAIHNPMNVLLKRDWTEEYLQCPKWGGDWLVAVSEKVEEWPPGIEVFGGRMFFESCLCVPSSLTAQVVRQHHADCGHPGPDRLWADLQRRYAWADACLARRFSTAVARLCLTCQACEPPHFQVATVQEPTPVPPHIFDSIALDIFKMPLTKHEGREYDCFVLCVDRLSGFVYAWPEKEEGLTGKKVAQRMLEKWETMGIPRMVTVDRGPQFVSGWWRALCGSLGVDIRYSQAYHHRANGRAERAGQSMQALLRKIHSDGKVNWVFALPKAVGMQNDLPGVCGMSPYEVVFGRTRPIPGVPIPPRMQALDAQEFFNRRKLVDEQISTALMAAHKNQAQRFNERLKAKDAFVVGDLVWFLRPRTHATNKLLSWWIGPCPVKDRVGENSYIIEVKPGVEMDVHRQHMKLCFHDPEVLHPPSHLFLLTERDEQELVEEAGVPSAHGPQAASSSSSSSSSGAQRSLRTAFLGEGAEAASQSDFSDWVDVEQEVFGGSNAAGHGGEATDVNFMAEVDPILNFNMEETNQSIQSIQRPSPLPQPLPLCDLQQLCQHQELVDTLDSCGVSEPLPGSNALSFVQ